jgi:hypothetical protein
VPDTDWPRCRFHVTHTDAGSRVSKIAAHRLQSAQSEVGHDTVRMASVARPCSPKRPAFREFICWVYSLRPDIIVAAPA